MDELNTTGMEMTGTEPDTTPHDPDDWSDLDFSDVEVLDADQGEEAPSEPETDKSTPEKEETAEDDSNQEQKEEEQPTEEPAQEAEQKDEGHQLTFELKHLGQTQTVGKDEVIALAQKGMDYDHVAGERETARARVAYLEGFLNEAAASSGLSLEDFVDATRANMMAEREGMDYNIALQRVKFDREKQAFEAERNRANAQAQAQTEEEQRKKDNMLRFVQAYPGLPPQDVPQEVWDKFGAGEDLTASYALYENKKLKEQLETAQKELETAKQNNENKKKSTGSQKTAGATQEVDAFDAAWYDGT